MEVPAEVDVLGDADWDREVPASNLPVVVGFWAEWCIPCHMAAPALAEAARTFRKRLRFGLVNVDENPDLRKRFDVRGLPTVIVFKGGEPCQRRVGLMGRESLRRLLESCLQPGPGP